MDTKQMEHLGIPFWWHSTLQIFPLCQN